MTARRRRRRARAERSDIAAAAGRRQRRAAAVDAAAARLVAEVRAGRGPRLLHAVTYRVEGPCLGRPGELPRRRGTGRRAARPTRSLGAPATARRRRQPGPRSTRSSAARAEIEARRRRRPTPRRGPSRRPPSPTCRPREPANGVDDATRRPPRAALARRDAADAQRGRARRGRRPRRHVRPVPAACSRVSASSA